MNYSVEITKSIRTIYEMLTDRGIDASSLESYSVEESGNTNSIFSIDVNDRIKIIYDMSSKLNIANLKKMFDIDNEDPDIELLIFVVLAKINTTELKKFVDMKFDYQIFDIKSLQFNISKHKTLVPKHELITNEEEIQKILTSYQVKRSQLPLILKTDPMAKYLNAKEKNLVKITRNSPTSGEYIVYRCVV